MANIGDTLESKSLAVTQDLINEYAHICGDYNTLHVDVEGMKDHPLFGGTIAHGTINVEPVLQALCAIQGTLCSRHSVQFRELPGQKKAQSLICNSEPR